jgi:threonine dehydratase
MAPQLATLVDLDEIRDAARRIAGVAVRTPLMASPWPGLWLKPEGLQPVGAFKIRGAMTAMSRLDPDVRARGVIAHSSGNHAQAVAYAARVFGVAAHIVIPDSAPPRKVQATRALGATVELVPVEHRFSRPAELAALTGQAVIPPFDDRNVIAGQGTIGLEIAQDAYLIPGGPAAVLVPVSGGGLISGIAAALAALLPAVKVIGVEPELAGDAAESFRAGERRAWAPADTARTIADGLRTFSVGELPWEHIRTQVHDIITVSEKEILDATRRLALEARLVAEPSGAVATAGFLYHRDQLPAGDSVAVVSGGNIDPEVFRMVLDA